MIYRVLKVAHTYFIAVESTTYNAKNVQKELVAISAVKVLIASMVTAISLDGASLGMI